MLLRYSSKLAGTRDEDHSCGRWVETVGSKRNIEMTNGGLRVECISHRDESIITTQMVNK